LQGAADRGERAARNEALFRRVNERVQEVNRAFESILEEAVFFCECADVDCMDKIGMTLHEYEALRDISTHFAVMPGHVLPEDERVAEERAGYVVVEKVGRARAGRRPRSSGTGHLERRHLPITQERHGSGERA
jgi:hypothetical protein